MVGLLAGAAKGLMKKPQKINPDKFAGKMEETKAASQPKGGIVPFQKDSLSIVKVVDIKPKEPKVKAKGGPLAEIQESVHSIVVAFKGEEDAKKKRIQQKNKKNQKKKRLNLEALSELGKTTSKVAGGIASATGMTSLWGAIWKTVGLLFAGWLTNFIPQIVGFVTKFIDITKKVIDVAKPIVGFIWDSLVWITDKGVKLLAMVSGIKPDEASENSIIKNLTEIQKKLPLIEAAFGFFALLKLKDAFGGPRGPKPKNPKPKNPKPKKPKWQKKLQQKWKNSELGKTVRNVQAGWKKTTRKISQAVNPQKIVQKLQKTEIGKTVTKTLDSVRNFKIQDVGKKKWFKNLRGGVTDLAGRGGRFLQSAGQGIVKLGKGLLSSLPDFNKLGSQLGGALSEAYQNSAKWVQKRYDAAVTISKSLKSKYDNALKSAGNAFNNMKAGVKQKLMEKVLEPAMKYLEPALKRMKSIGGSIMGVLKKIPGYDKITKVLQKFGGAGSEGLMKKIGGKAIPVIGGIVNMLFAYDRLAKGDSIGGLIEGASGILDLSALPPPIGIGFLPGPNISMGLDAYMFARDFVPQIQEGEEAVVKKLGLSGLKSNIDNIFSKLPDLGQITSWITGGDKKDKTEGVTEEGGVTTPPPSRSISKEFKIGKETLDLSKPMGGLTQDEWNNLTAGQRNMINRRIDKYQSQTSDLSGVESKSKDADLISESASYDDKAGKSTIIPVPIDAMKGGGNATVKTIVTSGDGVNKYDAVAESKKTMVLSKMYS
jgi:hypothetical protein